jgi:hypothetical protein
VGRDVSNWSMAWERGGGRVLQLSLLGASFCQLERVRPGSQATPILARLLPFSGRLLCPQDQIAPVFIVSEPRGRRFKM